MLGFDCFADTGERERERERERVERACCFYVSLNLSFFELANVYHFTWTTPGYDGYIILVNDDGI